MVRALGFNVRALGFNSEGTGKDTGKGTGAPSWGANGLFGLRGMGTRGGGGQRRGFRV
jgi:hypothetical protein